MAARAHISFRIGLDLWVEDRRFEDLKAMLRRFPGVADQITLFHSVTHAPIRLDIARRRADVLTGRLRSLRHLGCEAGVNILTTIGHHEENLPNSLSGDYTPMTTLDGRVSRGSFCPNDERVREYVRELYRIITGTDPDYIWIDDDVRVWHWPMDAEGCYCDNCLSLFSEECGTTYTRERLKAALGAESEEDRLKVKRAWLQHNRDTISRLFTLIERTVHGLKPDLPIGFMTGDRFAEGYDFDVWADVLSGPERASVLWRPGGGYYREADPRDMTQKSLSVARQVALLPECVRSIQPEIERLPGNRFGSSDRMMSTQAALYMAAGGTGAAFDSLLDDEDPPELAFPLLTKIQALRPFYDRIVRTMGRGKPMGIFDFWDKDSAAVGGLVPSHDMFGVGLPATYDREGAVVTLLSGDGILAWQDDEERIVQLLSDGVYMDAEALCRLNRMGYAELTGFAVDRFLAVDCIERYTDHPLNMGIAGRLRDARQSFLDVTCPAAVLTPTQPGAEALCGVIDYTPKDVAPCCTGVFENKLGGRVCVAGYYPWTLLHFFAKLDQIKSIMRWLSRDALPAYVASPHRAHIWVRPGVGGGLAIAVINAHFDPADELVLAIRTDQDSVRLYDMDDNESDLSCRTVDGPYRQFVVQQLGDWEMRLVVAAQKHDRASEISTGIALDGL